jgi:twinkle protein
MIVPHDHIRDAVFHLYRSGGLPRGTSTGWPSVDRLYTVGMGQWTVVTGTPNSGKSEWVDALMVNLAKQEPWRFFIYSPENQPLELHHAKIREKYLGKPFNPGPTQRMDEEELDAGEEWMRGKFTFCKPDQPDIVSIINEAVEIAQKHPDPSKHRFKTGVVVDPWNQLEHYRPAHQTMTEYVSQTLSSVIAMVREFNLHLWLVAHPAKLRKDRDGKYPIPTPHDIADSAHFWNKADNCVTVWRDQVEGSEDVDIHIQKVRWKHIGRIGLTTLVYDRVTGQYRDKPGQPEPRSISEWKRKSA